MDKKLQYIYRQLDRVYGIIDDILIKIEESEHKGDEAFTPAERQLSIRLDRRC
jgi:hypothetical protein